MTYENNNDLDSWKITLFKDENLMKVLGSLKNGSKSVHELSDDCKMSISQVYKKLDVLKENNMLHFIDCNKYNLKQT